MENNRLLQTTLLALILVGNASFAAEPRQKYCPLMVEDAAEMDTFVKYKGVKVFLCCSSCKRQWNENPDYFAVVSVKQAPQLKPVASQEIKALDQEFCPVYTDRRVHPKGPSLVHNGKKIYFSKTRALERFQTSPDRYLKNLK